MPPERLSNRRSVLSARQLRLMMSMCVKLNVSCRPCGGEHTQNVAQIRAELTVQLYLCMRVRRIYLVRWTMQLWQRVWAFQT